MRQQIGFTIFGGILMLAIVAMFAITFPQAAVSSPITPVANPSGSLNIVSPDNPAETSSELAPLQQIGTAGVYLWSYSAKFVCGLQAPLTAQAPGEPVVKPGNYATEINVHNSNFRTTVVKKFLIVLVDPIQGIVGREPNAQSPRASVTATMGINTAMMDDCNALYLMGFAGAPPPGSPPSLMVGYLVIVSPIDLNVDIVYTTQDPGTVTYPPSIDVTHVLGKRVFAPIGTYP